MTTFDDAAALAANPTFQDRIIACAANVATEIGVATLAMDSPTEPDKARFRLARDVLLDPEKWTLTWSWAVAVQGGIDISTIDTDLKFQVETLWNLVAGVPF